MQRATRQRLGDLVNVVRNLSMPSTAPRIFGVGAAKTGTHTIGEMFADTVPSAHEADAERLISHILQERDGVRPGALQRYLRWRDLKRGLRIDASQVNIYLLDHLEHLFSGSRYILTVRDPRAWLRSITDDSLRREVSPIWMRFRNMRFGEMPFTPEDEPLMRRGLYPLRGYLNYWRHSIESVRSRVPADRLLTVRTDEIDARGAEIARFCQLEDWRQERVHSFANPERFGVLEELDSSYLEDCIAEATTDEVNAALKPCVAKNEASSDALGGLDYGRNDHELHAQQRGVDRKKAEIHPRDRESDR